MRKFIRAGRQRRNNNYGYTVTLVAPAIACHARIRQLRPTSTVIWGLHTGFLRTNLRLQYRQKNRTKKGEKTIKVNSHRNRKGWPVFKSPGARGLRQKNCIQSISCRVFVRWAARPKKPLHGSILNCQLAFLRGRQVVRCFAWHRFGILIYFLTSLGCG